MTDRQPIGPLIDSLGVTYALDDHEIVTDAIVILKAVDTSDDRTALRTAVTPGNSWIERIGLLTATLAAELHDMHTPDDV